MARGSDARDPPVVVSYLRMLNKQTRTQTLKSYGDVIHSFRFVVIFKLFCVYLFCVIIYLCCMLFNDKLSDSVCITRISNMLCSVVITITKIYEMNKLNYV